jgi:hypothetical protein
VRDIQLFLKLLAARVYSARLASGIRVLTEVTSTFGGPNAETSRAALRLCRSSSDRLT